MPLYAVNWHPAYFDPSVFDERENLYSANPNGMTRSELARIIAQGRRTASEEPHGFAVDSRNTVTLAAGRAARTSTRSQPDTGGIGRG